MKYSFLASLACFPLLAGANDIDVIRGDGSLADLQPGIHVFAPPSLPLSMDVPGTYLNQIYVSVFRADERGEQRWAGRLKQYRFGMNADAKGKDKDKIYLAYADQDEDGKPAPVIDPATGLIRPDYQSADKSEPIQAARKNTHPNEKRAAGKVYTCSSLDGCFGTVLENFSVNNRNVLARLGSDSRSLIERITSGGKNMQSPDGALGNIHASRHGGMPHSRPVIINYGNNKGVVAYYGSNEGALRAVRADDVAKEGAALWSFISSEHYEKLARLHDDQPSAEKVGDYFDGNIGVYQSADLEKTHIFVSMRRGGRAIYAFDVSNPAAPAFLWKRSHRNAGFSELGLTFSEPKVAAIRREANLTCDLKNPASYKLVLVFGAGYDAAEEDKQPGQVRAPQMGRGIFVLDAASGDIVKFLPPANSGKKYSFAADVTLLDTDSDACIDRLYAVDTGGNIHRYEVPGADAASWNAYHVAQLGDTEGKGGSNDRKFLYPIDAVIGYEGSAPVVYLMGGTGDRESPGDATVRNVFVMIKDTLTATTANNVTPAYPRTLADLQQVTIFDPHSPRAPNPHAENFLGWFLPLAADGEKTVNAPLTVAGVTYFGTHIPGGTSRQSGTNLGEARGYALNFLNGTAGAGDRDEDGRINERDLYANFVGGSLPPSPVTGVVKLENKYVRFIIGSGGMGKESSILDAHLVQAPPHSNRTRVYWYFKKD